MKTKVESAKWIASLEGVRYEFERAGYWVLEYIGYRWHDESKKWRRVKSDPRPPEEFQYIGVIDE